MKQEPQTYNCQVAFQTHCTNWQHGKLEKGWNGKLCCSYRTNYKFVRAVSACMCACGYITTTSQDISLPSKG